MQALKVNAILNRRLSFKYFHATSRKRLLQLHYKSCCKITQGLSFAYQLLYLLDATGFYSLGLHALGIQVCRVTGQEVVQSALLSCTYTVLDYAQTGLISAVFFFKMMEWWYQSAEERMSAPTVYPPPPPKVAK